MIDQLVQISSGFSLNVPLSFKLVANDPLFHESLPFIAFHRKHFPFHRKFNVIDKSEFETVAAVSSQDLVLLLNDGFHYNRLQCTSLPLYGPIVSYIGCYLKRLPLVGKT